jgi:hypothetical protein
VGKKGHRRLPVEHSTWSTRNLCNSSRGCSPQIMQIGNRLIASITPFAKSKAIHCTHKNSCECIQRLLVVVSVSHRTCYKTLARNTLHASQRTIASQESARDVLKKCHQQDCTWKRRSFQSPIVTCKYTLALSPQTLVLPSSSRAPSPMTYQLSPKGQSTVHAESIRTCIVIGEHLIGVPSSISASRVNIFQNTRAIDCEYACWCASIMNAERYLTALDMTKTYLQLLL